MGFVMIPRRVLLLAPGLGVLASATSAWGATVNPIHSQTIVDRYGVCAHPNFLTTTYQHREGWVRRLADLGASYFRGVYSPQQGGPFNETVALCRQYGVKWLMEVVADGDSVADTEVKVAHIAGNTADICFGIEGRNEPNHVRGGGAVPADWAAQAVAFQRAIWNRAKGSPALSGALIVGPSLHNSNAYASYNTGNTNPVGGPRHFHQLAAAGVLECQDVAGFHTYPGGYVPLHMVDQRFANLYSAYGSGYPIWVTEWGYHNALAQSGGQLPINEWGSGVYGPRGVLEFCGQRGVSMARYEMLDDPDSGSKNMQEANFGLWRVSTVGGDPDTTWVAKPEVGKLTALLSSLRDPGPVYTPPPIGVTVVGGTDVQHIVTGKRDGSVTLWAWRAAACWDPVAEKALTVGGVNVTVTDPRGARTLAVGRDVVGLSLRR
jgi:hypothetical protein